MLQIPPPTRISPADFNAFFGYYDVVASDFRQRHLAHHPAFIDRLPRMGEPVVLGWYAPSSPHADARPFTPVAESRAWNFQQGSQLQWIGPLRDRLIWNDAAANGELHAVIADDSGSTIQTLPLPVVNVSRDASKALSLNFERLMDYRPGYGYPNRKDPFHSEAAPAQDGLFTIDITSGRAKLVLSLHDCLHLMRSSGLPANAKIVINHATLNPSGTHLIALARPFRESGLPIATTVIHAAIDGSSAKALLPYGMASHYYWINDHELLFWCDGPIGPGLYRIDCNDHSLHPVDSARFKEDIHMSLDSSGQWMVYDTYPDQDRKQHLQLYHLESGAHYNLASLYSIPSDPIDIRCDLHPRWNAHYDGITFDSTHEGYRAIYSLDLNSILQKN